MNRRWLEIGFLVLLANAFYLWTSSAATIFYMGNAVLHLVLGVAVFAVVMRVLQPERPWRLIAAAAALLGLFLAIWGQHVRSSLGAMGAHRRGARVYRLDAAANGTLANRHGRRCHRRASRTAVLSESTHPQSRTRAAVYGR